MIDYVVKDLTNYIYRFFWQSLIVGIVSGVFVYIYLKHKTKDGSVVLTDKKIIIKGLTVTLLMIYLYLIIGITLLCREPIFERTVALKLFSYIHNDRQTAYLFENLIMFIPYGIMLPIPFHRFRFWNRTLLMGLMSSVIIEITQIITMRGYAQLDDLILNTAGMMIGYGIITICIGIRDKHVERKNKKEED